MMFGIPLWLMTLLALVGGALCGLWFPQFAVWVMPIGQLFLQALKMLVVPLVLVSITHAVGSVSSVGSAGRIGTYSLLGYVFTTLSIVPLGLGIMFFVEVEPLDLSTTVLTPELTDVGIDIRQLIPANIVDAMAQGNVLGLIVFALLLGVAANRANAAGEAFRNLVASAMQVVQELTSIVVSFAPLGVFSLMAITSADYGLEVIGPLLQLILLVYLGCFLHVFVTLHLILRIGTGRGIHGFLAAVFPALLMAFSTTTAAGTLPESMRCAEQNLGIKPEVSRFVLPIGATINMDGTALYQLVVALFVAQWYGIDLSALQYVTLSITVVLMSIGTAAIPSGGLVVLSAVLASVGLPIEAVAVVAGIDRILDMARTTVNVAGDLTVTSVIDHRLRDAHA